VLLQRYGSGMVERLAAMFDEAGLPHSDTLEKVPNSRQALMLSELARDRGVFEPLHRRLFDAYWAQGRDIGDQSVLVEEGVAVGLSGAEVIDALADAGYLRRVIEHTEAALEVGAGGVPAWLIDERLLVPGAQPHELFEQVMGRLGHEPTGAAA
jgi:predicted DsbA family dithiol-disulfide isomerase